mmetsp:Transcript_71376/g.126094  ORF Transcript_71376/g.126094 Transcript_71376/m.126094 type:complete len:162 (-) Transcript_71376:71-556(-)
MTMVMEAPLAVPPTKDFRLTKVSGEVPGHLVIVHACQNSIYVQPVVKACEAIFSASSQGYELVEVPSVRELVDGCREAVHSGASAIVCIGVLIKDESDAYQSDCKSVMQGLMHLNAEQDVPVISGVLMCPDKQQASERSFGTGNPGRGLAESALFMSKVTP